MNTYVKNHERMILECIRTKEVDQKLAEAHQLRILWLQHERLVHLVIFLFTVLVLILIFLGTLLMDHLLLYVVMAILLIVSVFYCLHYFFLENAVQRWYRLYDEIEIVIRNQSPKI